jgi:ABC-type transport system involved in multi-copper enzyme maturation permease subunit
MLEFAGAPSSAHVVRVLARREIALGLKRKLLKLLFLLSLLPPLIMTIVVIARIVAEQTTGFDLGWDPLLRVLHFQTLPVTLLALGLGTPSVARDRAEDVLFLYATRPLQPWHYAMGKLLAVAIPTTALMFLPGLLIFLLRFSVTAEIGLGEAVLMTVKHLLASTAFGWGLGGICIGASTIVRKGRWALLLAFMALTLPDILAAIAWLGNAPLPFGLGSLVKDLLESFFAGGRVSPLWCLAMLIAWGGLGFWLTLSRVRREMIP